MRVDEFIRLAARESNRTLVVPVLVDRVDGGPSRLVPNVLLSDLFKNVEVSGTRRVDVGHRLGPGADDRAIVALEERLGIGSLPHGLRELVGRIDGVHLWAEIPDGRSVLGIAPIAEWQRLDDILGPDPLGDGVVPVDGVAISYHQDGEEIVVWRPRHGGYYYRGIDELGPGSRIADDVEGLLEWLWKNRMAP